MKLGFYIGVLLYQHDCVVIPGFGGFIANYVPAHIHPVQHTFIPPSRQIMFNASLIHNDGLLANHVAGVEGISYDQALNRIEEGIALVYKELKSGKSITLEGLGSLRFNHERNYVFTPKAAQNYLEDAYGLPTFVSPAIRRNDYHRSIQDSKTKTHVIHFPAAVKRVAAIALPLLAIGMWSLFNTDRISDFTSSHTSIFPSSELLSQFSVSSIKKSIPTYVFSHARAPISNAHPAAHTAPEVKVKTEVSEPVTEKAKVKIAAPQHAVVTKTISESTEKYLIISGAFKVKENAEKLLSQLKAKNLEATMAGQNKKGLFLVSAATCDDSDQANLKLKELLNKGIEAAWILKK